MSRKRYPSDLTDKQWRIFSLYIPAPKDGGRPAEIERREIVNAILYVTTQGISWRSVPHDFPHWFTVYSYFRTWCRAGIWESANAALVQKERILTGRDPQRRRDGFSNGQDHGLGQSGTVLAQLQHLTGWAAFRACPPKRGLERGYDGNKKVKGRKRFLITDTFGRILKCHVCAANTGERTGGRALLHSIKARWVKLKAAFVDGGYSGVDFKAEIKASTGITLEHVATPNAYREFAQVMGFPPQAGEFEQAIKEWRAGQKGFVVQAKRWVVERTNAWMLTCRRLRVDYEVLPRHSEGFIYLAMCRILLIRLAKCPRLVV